MQKLNDFLLLLDSYLGSHVWFIILLIGVGIFFTIYLGFPQFRYFNHAIRIVKGKYDKKGDKGDTSHFQALATALSGTVGTGNIAGVALAIHLGGPAALFWMLVTALFGMTTKFVEVTLSHKYRDITSDGTVAGGPMYYMRKRLNIKLKSGKTIKTGHIMGIIFAIGTLLSTFGTGCLPQINSISNALFSTFGISKILTGGVLAVFLGLVIVGGIKRIAKVTSGLVPIMAIIYIVGALAVLAYNYDNIIPAFTSIFTNVFTGTSAMGGFLGASFSFAVQKGVGRGLFSNEAGQGSAPIAHAAARAHEPVSEGMVAILEPFIDTIVICTITGLVLLSSGAWTKKIENEFQLVDIEFLEGEYSDDNENDRNILLEHITGESLVNEFSGELECTNGIIDIDGYTILHARSVADDIKVFIDEELYSGKIEITKGKYSGSEYLRFEGKSLIHSAPLTAEAFKSSLFGNFGQYIVSIGLLLFAFSTAISWSYYGSRAVTFLFGVKSVVYYQIVYVAGFFLAAFVDTTIIWSISLITIVLMTLPNLIGLLCLHKEVKETINKYWSDFRKEFPE